MKLDDVASNTYCFDWLTEQNILLLVGPVRCQGMTADVVFVVSMKRQWNDTKYQGLAAQLKLLGIHGTRGRLRTYPFVHELTAATNLPRGGEQYNICSYSNAFAAIVKHLQL